MPRGAASSPVIVMAVVSVLLATATLLFPPTCMKEYQELIKLVDFGITNNATSSSSTGMGSNGEVSLWSIYSEAGQTSTTTLAANRTSVVVDVGLEAQQENGYPLEPVVANVLPRRLFLIYGLESSGTTFTARTIATALGIDPAKKGDFLETKNNQDHVQHISLPWGMVQRDKFGFETQYSVPLPMVPVFYPKACQMNPMPGKKAPPALRRPPSHECVQIMGDEVLTRPHRFMVNMTTNIQWYRERGVRVYPIMVVRDPMLHFQGIVNRKGGHCPNPMAAYQQYEQGRAIMIETVEKGLKPIIISYETMLTLQKPYLKELYDKLGIQSNFFPGFRNGNTKYLSLPAKPHLYVELELMKEDAPPPKKAVPSNNVRPPSPLNQRPKGMTNRGSPPRTSQQTGSHARLNRAGIEDRDEKQKNGEMHNVQFVKKRKTTIQNTERYREALPK